MMGWDDRLDSAGRPAIQGTAASEGGRHSRAWPGPDRRAVGAAYRTTDATVRLERKNARAEGRVDGPKMDPPWQLKGQPFQGVDVL